MRQLLFYYQYIISKDIIKDAQLQKLADLYGKNPVGLMPTGSLLVYSYSSFGRHIWKEPIAAIINEKDIRHEPLDKETGKPKNPPPHRIKMYSLIWDWKHIGKIEAGRNADILVPDADPTKSIKNLKKIDRLVVKGKMIDRKSLMTK